MLALLCVEMQSEAFLVREVPGSLPEKGQGTEVSHSREMTGQLQTAPP